MSATRENKKYISILEEISSKYNLSKIKEAIYKTQKTKVKIGFLGEFNAGKSSLINAILGLQILPAMERPTTKNIITIIPDDTANTPKFYKELEGELLEIDNSEFQEIALGRKEGSVLIKISPSTTQIMKDFVIIDTPGVASLNKSDVSITLEYLPDIDAAVVCQDITFGTIPKSVLEFLKRPEIKAISDKIVFVLTKADRIPQEEIKNVKDSVISVLQEFYKSIGMNLNLKSRVYTTSAKLSLEGKKEYIEEFLEGIKKEIIEQKEKLKEERIRKELKKIAGNIIETLEYMKNQAKPETATIDEEIKKIKKEVSLLEREKEKIYKKLDDIELDITRKAAQLLNTYKLDIISASNEEDINEIIISLQQELQNHIENLLKSKLKIEAINNLLGVREATQKIKEDIIKEFEKVDILKTISTMALIAIVGPEKGAGDILEAVGGYIISKLPKLEKTGNIISYIGKVSKYINPIDIVANPLKKKYLENKYEGLVLFVSKSVSKTIRNELESILEENFENLETQIENKKEALEELQKNKLETMEQVKELKEKIQEDIKTLHDAFINE